MKGRFIDFIKEIFTSVKGREKNFNKFFENNMAAQNLSQTDPFFVGQPPRPDHYRSQFCT